MAEKIGKGICRIFQIGFAVLALLWTIECISLGWEGLFTFQMVSVMVNILVILRIEIMVNDL